MCEVKLAVTCGETCLVLVPNQGTLTYVKLPARIRQKWNIVKTGAKP